jgi:hypothetical protein
MDDQNKRKLAAPCGLYCGACSTYIARKRDDKAALNAVAKRVAERRGWVIKPEEDLVCDGCLSSQLAIFCRQCAMRDCALEKGITQCAQCSEFPCRTITNFNNDGRPHHGEVLANVCRQQEIGIDAWLEEQEKRWCCSNCGYAIEWYETKCPQCTSTLPEQFK